jgi:hypothetical protein
MTDAPDERPATDDLGSESGVEEGLVDWSEHGLGLYLDPTAPVAPRRDEAGRRIWIREAWDWVVDHASDTPLPPWMETYALTRFTVSGPRIAGWFKGFDASRRQEERIRPGSFGLLAHPVGFLRGLSGGALPAAPYDQDPARWPRLGWLDRRDGKPIRVATMEELEDPEQRELALARKDVIIQSLGSVLRRYPFRPEHKSLAPDRQPAAGDTAGLLRRRPVLSAPVLTDLTGKEGNKLIERLTGVITAPADYRTDYGTRADRWRFLVLPVLRAIGARVLAERTGMSRRAVERALRRQKPTEPHAATKALYVRAAAEWVADRLPVDALGRSPHPLGTIYRFRRQFGKAVPTCQCGCGFPLPLGHRKWYSDAHRKKAHRDAGL